MHKWIVQGLAPLAGAGLLLLALIGVGRAARASLHHRPSYRVAFADLDCTPPEGMSRTAFLDEVRSLTRQADALAVLDNDLTARLHRAFLVHPWVESVRRVDIEPRRSGKTAVRLDLAYRRPVLAVGTSRDQAVEGGNGKWMVDRYGVLLPTSKIPAHLPILIGAVPPPSGPAGSRWGDARVAVAAKTVAFLQSHLGRLHLDNSQVEVIDGEIIFRRPGVRIVWGHAPGQEKADEASAKVKLRRLLEYQKEHNGLDSLEHDVRLLAYQGHFPLSAGTPTTAVSLYPSSQAPSSRNRDHVSNSSPSWRSCFNDANPPAASASSR
jgi:hypothetical protein